MADKWMQAASKTMASSGTKGALHESMGVSQDEKISTARLRAEAARLEAKAKGDKKLSADELKKLHRIQFALRARSK